MLDHAFRHSSARLLAPRWTAEPTSGGGPDGQVIGPPAGVHRRASHPPLWHGNARNKRRYKLRVKIPGRLPAVFFSMSKPHPRRRESVRFVDRVFTFDEFAERNSISVTTLNRLIRRGDGPPVMKLGLRKRGIRESDGAEWQASRVRERA
jgi:predicted DNA-binding transcriptional regulator AlpA